MNGLQKFFTPSTLPQAIVLGCVILAVGAVLVAFIRKAPLYALWVTLTLIFFTFLAAS